MRTSRVQKQALSAALAYSPSEISKYLSGKRLPTPQAIGDLVERTAAFFADAYWSAPNGDGLAEVFPLQVPFRRKEDIQALLRQALEEAYFFSAHASPDPATRPIFGNALVTGWDEVVRALMVQFAHALHDQQQPVSYYDLRVYLSMLERKALPLPTTFFDDRLQVNVLIPGKADDQLTLARLRVLLEHWQVYHALVRLRLWSADEGHVQPFVFCPNYFALMLVTSLPGYPVGALMRSGQYLMQYELLNTFVFSQGCSWSREELVSLLERGDDAAYLDAMDSLEAIYAFDNIGFFARPEHLERLGGTRKLKRFISRLLERITSKSVPYVVSMEAIGVFSSTGTTVVPLLGQLTFDHAESVTYMKRYEELKDAPNHWMGHITSASFIRCTIAVLREHVLILLPLNDGADQEFIRLPRAVCGVLLKELDNIKTKESTPITAELWGHYIRHLPNLRVSGM
ncbi:MAG: hypothetical protein GX810_05865 [Clostridiales bacterium]|nr:hypothetical protein [Clostridiales bacterium]